MPLNLLDTLVTFADERGLDRPASVMDTTDGTIRQLTAIANKVVADIVSRPGSWALLQKEGNFTSVGGEDQGLMTTMAPYGFQYLIPETIYDRTNRRQLFGPRNAPDWQMNKAMIFTGPFYSFRVWQGRLFVQPDMPGAEAGLEIYFEYASDYGILDVDGITYKKRFDADTDIFTLGEDILLRGIEWRWRRQQGMAYTQEFDDFENMLHNLMGRQSTAGVLNMNGSSGDIKPGVIVPSGNWNV